MQGSSLICVHPTRRARQQNKAEGGGNEMAPHQDTQTRSRLSIGEDGPSDSALAAARDGRLRRTATERRSESPEAFDPPRLRATALRASTLPCAPLLSRPVGGSLPVSQTAAAGGEHAALPSVCN